MSRASVLLIVVTAMSWGTGWAHNPIVIDGGPTDATTAYKIDDITVSRVAYHHAYASQPFIWMTFDAEAGQTVEFQMGVPLILRYAAIRPATAILGPGLPPAEGLPFTVPEGLGAVVFTTEGQEPVVFHEEFTGTNSWQFQRESLTLPQGGQYFMVGYLPSAEEGKFWVAPGTREVFGFADILRLPSTVVKVRLFHEVFPWGGLLGWGFLGLVCVLGALVVGLFRFFR